MKAPYHKRKGKIQSCVVRFIWDDGDKKKDKLAFAEMMLNRMSVTIVELNKRT